MLTSKLEFYSVGIVAKNKELKSRIIEVVPIESSAFLDGELTSDRTTVSADFTDASGAATKTEIQSSPSKPATWLPFGNSNRMTAPDVRRGAYVLIWRFAENQELWWTTLMDDYAIRKLETVTFAISGTRDEKTPSDSSNSYYMHWSTHEKLIALHTSQADGEKVGYDFQINTGDSTILIVDTEGNQISIDSLEHRIEIENKDGSHFDLNKRELTLTLPDKFTVKTKDIVYECETISTNASTSITTTTGSISTKASTEVVEAETTHKGNFMEQGDLTVAGNISGIPGSAGGGGGTFSGSIRTEENLEANGNINVDGTLTAGKVISSQDIDAPNV